MDISVKDNLEKTSVWKPLRWFQDKFKKKALPEKIQQPKIKMPKIQKPRTYQQDDSMIQLQTLLEQGYDRCTWHLSDSHLITDICDELNNQEFDLNDFLQNRNHNAPIFETSHSGCKCYVDVWSSSDPDKPKMAINSGGRWASLKLSAKESIIMELFKAIHNKIDQSYLVSEQKKYLNDIIQFRQKGIESESDTILFLKHILSFDFNQDYDNIVKELVVPKQLYISPKDKLEQKATRSKNFNTGNSFVDSLEFPLTIYRGSKEHDIDINHPGISWTTEFAIANSDEFAGEDGVVLTTTINKDDILLEDTIERNNEFGNTEKEIVVKEENIKTIHIKSNDYEKIIKKAFVNPVKLLKIYKEYSQGILPDKADLFEIASEILDYYKTYIFNMKTYLELDIDKTANPERYKKIPFVLEQYQHRAEELQSAMSDMDEKKLMTAIDNAINQTHIDFSVLVHLRMQIESELMDEEEDIALPILDNYDKFLDFFHDILKQQGKEIPHGEWEQAERKLYRRSSVIDYPYKDLPHDLWEKKNGEYVLKPEIERQIIEMAEENLLMKFGERYKEWFVGLLLGSSLSTNFFLPDSDMDIKIIVSDQFTQDIDDGIKALRDSSYLIHNHPVDWYIYKEEELAAEDFNDKYDSLYDILNAEWLKPPYLLQDISQFPREEILSRAKKEALDWASKADLLIGDLKRHTKEFDAIKAHLSILNPDEKKQFKEEIDKLLLDIESDIEKLVKEKEDITEDRHKGYQVKFQPDLEKYYISLNWTTPNIRFKLVQKWGYFALISALSDFVDDQKVTEEEVPQIEQILKENKLDYKQIEAKYISIKDKLYRKGDINIDNVFDCIDSKASQEFKQGENQKALHTLSRGIEFANYISIKDQLQKSGEDKTIKPTSSPQEIIKDSNHSFPEKTTNKFDESSQKDSLVDEYIPSDSKENLAGKMLDQMIEKLIIKINATSLPQENKSTLLMAFQEKIKEHLGEGEQPDKVQYIRLAISFVEVLLNMDLENKYQDTIHFIHEGIIPKEYISEKDKLAIKEIESIMALPEKFDTNIRDEAIYRHMAKQLKKHGQDKTNMGWIDPDGKVNFLDDIVSNHNNWAKKKLLELGFQAQEQSLEATDNLIALGWTRFLDSFGILVLTIKDLRTPPGYLMDFLQTYPLDKGVTIADISNQHITDTIANILEDGIEQQLLRTKSFAYISVKDKIQKVGTTQEKYINFHNNWDIAIGQLLFSIPFQKLWEIKEQFKNNTELTDWKKSFLYYINTAFKEQYGSVISLIEADPIKEQAGQQWAVVKNILKQSVDIFDIIPDIDRQAYISIRDQLQKNARSPETNIIQFYELEYKVDQLKRRNPEHPNIEKMELELREISDEIIKMMIQVFTVHLEGNEFAFENEPNDPTIKRIRKEDKKYIQKLQQALSSPLPNKVALISETLQWYHQGGSMLEELSGGYEIDFGLLQDLSDGKYVSRWDEELKKIATQQKQGTVYYHATDINPQDILDNKNFLGGTIAKNRSVAEGYKKFLDSEYRDMYRRGTGPKPKQVNILQIVTDKDYGDVVNVGETYRDHTAGDIWVEKIPIIDVRIASLQTQARGTQSYNSKGQIVKHHFTEHPPAIGWLVKARSWATRDFEDLLNEDQEYKVLDIRPDMILIKAGKVWHWFPIKFFKVIDYQNK